MKRQVRLLPKKKADEPMSVDSPENPADSGITSDAGPVEDPVNAKKVSILRHELATPINQIIGYTELLLEDLDDADPESVRDDLQTIRTATAHLHSLIQASIRADRISIFGDVASPALDRKMGPTESGAMSQVGVRDTREDDEHTVVAEHAAHVLVVDDVEQNRDLVRRQLERQGYTVDTAGNGREALEKIESGHFDLMLLDVIMPELDGFAVLEELRKRELLLELPVIMISGLTEVDSAARCIEIGAEDFLTKPFNPTLLHARVESSLERKRFHDARRELLDALHEEQEKSDRLLLNILPEEIANQLKEASSGEATLIAEQHSSASVLFLDLVGFTRLASEISARALVHLLDSLFSEFDRLTDIHGLEKIKTIGDAYMVAGGLPMPVPDHALRMARLALDMQSTLERFNQDNVHELHCRIGLHAGTVVAGVIGSRKFTYDLWGDAVNVASRMESYAPKNRIQVSAEFYELIKEEFECTLREGMEIRGLGVVDTYVIERRI